MAKIYVDSSWRAQYYTEVVMTQDRMEGAGRSRRRLEFRTGQLLTAAPL